MSLGKKAVKQAGIVVLRHRRGSQKWVLELVERDILTGRVYKAIGSFWQRHRLQEISFSERHRTAGVVQESPAKYLV